MVKKLLKYEFASLSKTLVPMEIILFAIALSVRVIQFFESDSGVYSAFFWSSVTALVLAMIVCVIMTKIVGVVRFYKNMYTAEGYLTLTLPVTHSAHIAAKLIAAGVMSLAALVSVFLAFMISTAGEVFHECVKAAEYIIRNAVEYLKWDALFYLLEAIVLFLLWEITTYLVYFTCVTIGQLAKKARILLAFGAYFGFYIIRQTAGVIGLVVFTLCYEKWHIDLLLDWIARNPRLFLHILAGIAFVILAVLSLICYTVTKHIMRKKLNLE